MPSLRLSLHPSTNNVCTHINMSRDTYTIYTYTYRQIYTYGYRHLLLHLDIATDEGMDIDTGLYVVVVGVSSRALEAVLKVLPQVPDYSAVFVHTEPYVEHRMHLCRRTLNNSAAILEGALFSAALAPFQSSDKLSMSRSPVSLLMLGHPSYP